VTVARTARSSSGFMLLEVLIAGLVLGIAMIGLALMFSHGLTFVVSEGDERVAMYLTQQKLEQKVDQLKSGLGSAGLANVLPIGSETETVTGGSGQSFTRFTCVIWVSNLTLGEPDASPNDCPCGAGGSATQTKKVCVKVTPSMPSRGPVVLKTLLTSPP